MGGRRRLFLQRPPQPLDEHVVQGTTSALHAHRHPVLLQTTGLRLRPELHPLIGVEDRGPTAAQGFFQALQAEPAVERVRQPPAEHVPAVPVDHRRPIREAPLQQDVGDIGGPDLIATVDRQPSKQIRVDHVARVSRARAWARMDRFRAHPGHQPRDTLAIDVLPVVEQPGSHPSAAEERCPEVLVVDHPHQPQVRGRLAGRFGVIARRVRPSSSHWPRMLKAG